jgi:outer membrane lipoprotein SlyB
MKTFAVPLLASLLSIVLTGCANPPPSASVYNYYQTQNEQIVRTGTVESIRNVTIMNPERGVGTVGGAALGGIAGSAAGEGKGQAAMTVIGALAGGLLGQHAEQNVNQKPGFEITVRLDTGELVAVTQAADEMFRPGERVRLLNSGQTTRVTH